MFTVYNGYGEKIVEWTSKRAAIASAKAMKADGSQCGHYVVNERNAELVWSA